MVSIRVISPVAVPAVAVTRLLTTASAFIASTRLARIEAKSVLIPRTHQLARAHGLSCNKVSVRNAKTRWGSCSSENNISLNIQLMRLPFELIDYVILHELAHTIHKNHGPNFWRLLDKISGDAKGLDYKLKAYHTAY